MKHQEYTLDLIFSIVDDFCKLHLKKRKRRGPKHTFSDGQIFKMIAIKYLFGVQSDRSLIRILKHGIAKGLFKKIPDHSQLNRRSKQLMYVTANFQKYLVKKLKCHFKEVRIIDSTPIPVKTYLRSSRSNTFPEASYGYCAATKEKYYGFKLHMLATIGGIPTDFDLTPANVHDLKMLDDLTEDYASLIVIGDKGYIGKNKQDELKDDNKILITPYRKNQKQKSNNWVKSKLLRYRRRMETVFSQLKDQMSLSRTRAKSLLGLASRVIGILFSFTLGIYINDLLGRKLLNIKSLLS